ncbi:hypothetical protein [Tenuibacillus multivorans]|uniref:Uncharacterized protein n=1 Tax=Tenuibacillus multivorans TaxID=237069 RepID=A0A1G9X3P7_9BACI|nr:hypothetical protein [Tenuibacillus multivorans]GEL77238.1 hypothetical protein TMU01_14730 [Tenuibacillus multivorans]SDM91404.1 hypothetical protein SAMN05216498_1002 [Tenuibacillus multivorans]
MDRKTIIVIGLIVVLAIATFFLNQDEEDQSNHYYIFTLEGQSENWELSNYTVEFVPTHQYAGNGQLDYLGDEAMTAQDFNFRVYAMIDGMGTSLQGKSITWNESTELSNMATGHVEGSIFKPNGDPVLFGDIEQIYATIHWRDADGQVVEERIDLYQQR